MNIRPVSDLRNKYNEVESMLRESGAVYLTKNGYGTAVLLDINEYIALTGSAVSVDSKVSKTAVSSRGFLHSYANPSLIDKEKEAGKIHAIKKYGNGEEQ